MSPLLYRVFYSTLIVFFAAVSLVSGAASARPAADDPYIVKGIAVDVTGASALDARNKAFVEARRKAYEAMAAKAAPGQNVIIPDDRVIAGAIRDFEIVNEKMTSRRYAGTVDVRFTAAAVKRTLQFSPAQGADNTLAGQQNGMAVGDAPAAAQPSSAAQPSPMNPNAPAVATPAAVPAANAPFAAPQQRRAMPDTALQQAGQPRPLLVLPWYGQMGRQTLWDQNNPWRAAWEEKTSLAKNKSIVLPVGDVEDVREYSPTQPLSRRGNIDALLRRYGADTAVITIAEPQQDGGVIVSLYKYEHGSTLPMGRFGMPNTRDTLGDAVSQAATTMGALPVTTVGNGPAVIQNPLSEAAPQNTRYSRPETQAASQPQMGQPQTGVPSPMGAYRTLARFGGLQEWVTIRQALARIPGMGAINVQSISPTQANLEFSYNGGPNMLVTAMAQNGLSLTQLPPDSVASPSLGGASPQFLLSIGRF